MSRKDILKSRNIKEGDKKGGGSVLELDEYKFELGKYKTPLAEVRDSL